MEYTKFDCKIHRSVHQLLRKFGNKKLIYIRIFKFTGEFYVINGVLQTAHSLFKRYRFEFKSQELWEEIKFVLDKLAKPLTDLLLVNIFYIPKLP